MRTFNEKVPFKLFAMPCLKTGSYTLIDAPGWLRVEGNEEPKKKPKPVKAYTIPELFDIHDPMDNDHD